MVASVLQGTKLLTSLDGRVLACAVCQVRIKIPAALADVVALLRSSTEEAARLWQSSPLAGLLTTEERRAIMGVYESRRP